MKRFQNFSAMDVNAATFRLSWIKYHEQMHIEYADGACRVDISLTLDQAEEAAKELMRLVKEAKKDPPSYDPSLPENAVKLD